MVSGGGLVTVTMFILYGCCASTPASPHHRMAYLPWPSSRDCYEQHASELVVSSRLFLLQTIFTHRKLGLGSVRFRRESSSAS